MGLGAQEAMSLASMAFCLVLKWENLWFLRVTQLHAARHIPGGCTRRGIVAPGLLLLEKPSVLPWAQRWAPSCLLLIQAAAAPGLPSAGWLQMGPVFGAADWSF